MAKDITVDLNKFYAQAREDVEKLIGAAKVNAAVIFNGSGSPVTFHVYNFMDTVYWVHAMTALIAPGHHGTVAALGDFFKIHPDNNKAHEFLVAPHKAYVYKGPGALEPV